MLRYYGLQHVQKLPGSPIFMQNGASAHTSNIVKEYLSRKLGNNWVCRGPIDWPARSPDLTPYDFFFWGSVKDKVHSERIKCLEHIKTRIRQAISRIDTAPVSNAWKNINTTINYIVRQEGSHIEKFNF